MNVSLNSDSNCTLKAVAVFRPSYHIIVSKIHLLYQAKTGRAWNTSPSKEIRESVEILFWSYSVVSFAAQANVVTHFLRSTILHCQAYEASNQIFIVIQFGSFRDFFLLLLWDKGHLLGGGKKNFQRSKTFPRPDQGVKWKQGELFATVNAMSPWRVFCSTWETLLSSVECLDSRDIRTTQSPALYGHVDGPKLF